MTMPRSRTFMSSKRHIRQRPYHQPEAVVDDKGISYTQGNAPVEGRSSPWLPSVYTAFKLILSARLSAAFWSNISDCDETYNYWEPAHFLIYGKGFQTWEYSPKYALRSYTYILLHAFPGWIYATLFQPNKMYVFYFMRCILALVCSLCEIFFYQGIIQEIGANVARLTLTFMVFSSGMYISSTAFLPSTTSMYFCMLSYGAWFKKQYRLSIFITALSTFISWPFAAALGIPIALDVMVRKKKWKLFISWSFLSLITILIPQVLIDREYYGKLVIAPWNIVTYNIFTSHGPDLYGTEPWYFYAQNGFLNFNFLFFAALAVLPLCILIHWLIPQPEKKGRNCIPYWMLYMGLYLWLFIFSYQPHKEERFLFPAYPLISLAGAHAIDSFQKLYYCLLVKKKGKHYLNSTNWISLTFIGIFSLLSLSRIAALYQGYHAPMDIWIDVNHIPKDIQPGETPFRLDENYRVCIGKEWYRFPSSFFLPSVNWDMEFLKSDFRGQLPKHYLENDPLATRTVSEDFNDMNLEEDSRYTVSLDQCDFIVDLDTGDDSREREVNYIRNQENWSIVKSYGFLNAKKFTVTRILRAFYVPYLSFKFGVYDTYALLKNDKRFQEK